MVNIDEQLIKVLPADRIYTSKLVAHLDWYTESFKHLIIVSSILEKRYILLNDHDEIELNAIYGLYFYEVIKESGEHEVYQGISRYIKESDWLGPYSFVLTTSRFNSKNDRQLIENNYDKLIFLHNEEVKIIESLSMDLRIGWTNESRKCGFIWIKHQHPFYMDEGILVPRKNCVTENLGIIWCTKEEAEMLMQRISVIALKFNNKRSKFLSYTTPNDFIDDFLTMMNKLSNRSIKLADLNDWSIKVLSEYSLN